MAPMEKGAEIIPRPFKLSINVGKLRFISHAASENETAIAIAAIGKALVRIDFDINAGVTERRIHQAIARAVAGNAGFGGADGFGLVC